MTIETPSAQDPQQLVADLERKRSLLKTINEFALKLMGITSESELVWYVAREVVANLGFDDCVVYLLDPERNLLRQAAAIGSKNPKNHDIVNALEIPIGRGITGHVAQTGQPLVVADLSKDSRYIPDLEPALSEICVPLTIDGAVVGVIDSEDPRPRHFGEEHLEILTTVAALTSATLKIIKEAGRAERRTAELGRVNDRLASEIAERERAEEAFRKTDTLIRALITNSPAETFVRDVAGRYVLVNPAWKAKMGLSDEEVLGKMNRDLLPKERAAIYDEQDRIVRETGQVLDTEVQAPFGDEIRTVHTIKFPLLGDNGEIAGIGGITNDVTDIRRAEQQLRQAQKMEAVGQLTGGVAHDFNNLLAVIQGNAELLAHRFTGNNPLTDAILRATVRGAELTQRLLAFSRQQPLHPQTIDLRSLVAGMSDLLRRSLGETIEIETVAPADLWAASADPGQVENALLNLAINARDAMPDGGKLTVQCLNAQLDDAYVAQNPEALAGDYVVLAVSDTGIGMAAEVQAHAFEPFFTTKEIGEGSGLGLSMVYGFAKQSGGHVAIYSEPGRGTTVKLYLPRMAGDAAAAAAGPADEDVPHGSGETVLVIEDDADVRDLALTLVEGLGYRAIGAPAAAEAREVLAREAVDLVLSDVVLPGGVSGPEFAEQARGIYPELRIIFMSGYPAEAATGNGLLAAGMVLLNKPFQRRQLARALRDALA